MRVALERPRPRPCHADDGPVHLRRQPARRCQRHPETHQALRTALDPSTVKVLGAQCDRVDQRAAMADIGLSPTALVPGPRRRHPVPARPGDRCLPSSAGPPRAVPRHLPLAAPLHRHHARRRGRWHPDHRRSPRPRQPGHHTQDLRSLSRRRRQGGSYRRPATPSPDFSLRLRTAPAHPQGTDGAPPAGDPTGLTEAPASPPSRKQDPGKCPTGRPLPRPLNASRSETGSPSALSSNDFPQSSSRRASSCGLLSKISADTPVLGQVMADGAGMDGFAGEWPRPRYHHWPTTSTVSMSRPRVRSCAWCRWTSVSSGCSACFSVPTLTIGTSRVGALGRFVDLRRGRCRSSWFAVKYTTRVRCAMRH